MKFELLWPGKYGPDGRRAAPPPAPPLPPAAERHGPPDAPNLLIHGDNLAVAGALADRAEGQVDLLYLDPPFATGDRFSLTAAVGDATRAAAEIDAYDDRQDDPGVFFADLALRLQAARRLLSPRGLLFLHLDARASHGAKLLLDDLFGPRSFRGEIIWDPGNGAKGRRFFSMQHQVLLACSRGDDWTFNGDDPALRKPFADGSLKSHFRHTDAEGRRFRRRVVNGKEYIYYADQGRRIGSVWADIPSMVAGSPIVDESTGYPTQKPLRLLERIITACSRPGDLVADLCCGSGTTLVAAQRLRRRWLGCDIGPLAIHTARKRLLAADAPFSLLRPPQAPPAPALDARLGPDGAAVIHSFHTPVENLPPGLGAGLDLLDAWSVGVLDQGVFEHRWQAQRTRRRRALPLTSPPLTDLRPPGPGAWAVRAYDLLGRAATATL